MTSKESKVAERILQNCHKPGLELKQLQLSENAITVVMELLERVNKGSEELYIPSPEVWTRQEHWTDRDSYLGKSLASTLVTMLQSALESSDFSRLEALPLEHLPSALKLGAVLVTDTMSQVTFKTFAGVFIVSFSGLEKQGMG